MVVPPESTTLAHIFADVTVTLVDETWLEQHFLATVALGANSGDAAKQKWKK